MNRILFVDDEPGILEGLRNSLRKQRNRWDMVFATSGAAALDEFDKGAFDLVVTDMRMPQMDGAELLSKVKARFPATARIVLSGHSDQSAVLRTLPVAHQFLSKPCDPEQLRAVIDRTCSVYSMLHKGPAQEVIGALDRLPSTPRTYQALKEAIADPDCTLAKVVGIVEQDPAMCVKILQLVNSAYFGLGRRMSSIRVAVTYLGLELVKALALSAHIFSTMEAARLGGLCLDEVQRHSLLMARMMQRMDSDPKRSEEAFTTGLVHDVGKVLMAMTFGERYQAVSERVRCEGIACHVAEQETFGTSHAEVGAYLLGVWGLPFQVVEAVALHHRPEGFQSAPEDAWLLVALHVAETLCEANSCGPAAPPMLDLAFVERVGCTEQLPQWRQMAAEQFKEEAS